MYKDLYNQLCLWQSIWKQTSEVDWKLFFNTDSIIEQEEGENEVRQKFLFDSNLALTHRRLLFFNHSINFL